MTLYCNMKTGSFRTSLLSTRKEQELWLLNDSFWVVTSPAALAFPSPPLPHLAEAIRSFVTQWGQYMAIKISYLTARLQRWASLKHSDHPSYRLLRSMKDECGNCYEAQYAALGCKWSSAPQCAFAGMCCVDGNCGGSLPEAFYGFRDMTSVCWGGKTLLLGHSREPLLVASHPTSGLAGKRCTAQSLVTQLCPQTCVSAWLETNFRHCCS